MTDKDYRPLENCLYENEISFSEAITFLVDRAPQTIEELTKVGPGQKILLEELIAKIERNEFKTTKEKGDTLEKLINVLFCSSVRPLFNVLYNLRTSTNEIDLILELTPTGHVLSLDQIYPFVSSELIIECKNHEKPLDVGLVGKFYSLLSTCNFSNGILVSWNGFTGRDWTDALGLIKKIALKDNIYILTLDKKDLRAVVNSERSLYSMLSEKYLSLKTDTDISQYKQTHQNESKCSTFIHTRENN